MNPPYHFNSSTIFLYNFAFLVLYIFSPLCACIKSGSLRIFLCFRSLGYCRMVEKQDRFHAHEIVILDCQYHLSATNRVGKDEYAKKHIPGALFFDMQR